MKSCKYVREVNSETVEKEVEAIRVKNGTMKAVRYLKENGYNVSKTQYIRHYRGECACSYTAAKVVAENRELKVLVIDIERERGFFQIDNYRGTRVLSETTDSKIGGYTLSGKFWDLSDGKSLIGRWIPYESVVSHPKTICAAWGWIGNPVIEFASEWNDGVKGFAEKIWKALDEADIVIGHNIKSFDDKHIKTLFIQNGLSKPSPYKVIDTLSILRSEFKLLSNSLDNACAALGLTKKSDHLDIYFYEKIDNREPAALDRLEKYNKGDIIATIELYLKLRPWMKNHPNVIPMSQDITQCQRCGSKNTTRTGYFSPSVLVYRMYRCDDCNGQFRTTHEVKGSTVKNI